MFLYYQVQKEREKEGEEFADKEIFVTSAYKKKLEEMRKEDEKEKYEEYLETIGDVTKQNDLGMFLVYFNIGFGVDKLFMKSNCNNKNFPCGMRYFPEVKSSLYMLLYGPPTI